MIMKTRIFRQIQPFLIFSKPQGSQGVEKTLNVENPERRSADTLVMDSFHFKAHETIKKRPESNLERLRVYNKI